MKFISKENPIADDIMELRLKLRSYNNQFTKPFERTSIMIQIRDEDGELLGGVYGTISWEWLHIDLLWVDERLRESGSGTKLIKQIEEQAREKGVHRFRLSTTSFQALDFYKKMGYKICGEIEDLPPGYTNYFLIKTDI
ncbi:MAG: GNAT family N-acetyltransferase [Balneolaceae bacterium]